MYGCWIPLSSLRRRRLGFQTVVEGVVLDMSLDIARIGVRNNKGAEVLASSPGMDGEVVHLI